MSDVTNNDLMNQFSLNSQLIQDVTAASSDVKDKLTVSTESNSLSRIEIENDEAVTFDSNGQNSEQEQNLSIPPKNAAESHAEQNLLIIKNEKTFETLNVNKAIASYVNNHRMPKAIKF